MDDNSYIKHARREFRATGWVDDNDKYCDEIQELICKQVLELLRLFGNHGHSGTSAPYAIQLFSKLANFEPIVPLTGEDWEWNKVDTDRWQNNRCSHVFKDGDGKACDIYGIIFKNQNGHCYTNNNSRIPVEFPYTPKSEFVNVNE